MKGSSSKLLATLGVLWIVVAIAMALLWLLDRPSIEISWQTETEYDSAGFNILRSPSEGGPFIKINDRLIPAAIDAAAGGEYAYEDMAVEVGKRYYYRLEDVELDGNKIQHSLISAEAPGRPSWILALVLILAAVGIIMLISARRGRSTTQ